MGKMDGRDRLKMRVTDELHEIPSRSARGYTHDEHGFLLASLTELHGNARHTVPRTL